MKLITRVAPQDAVSARPGKDRAFARAIVPVARIGHIGLAAHIGLVVCATAIGYVVARLTGLNDLSHSSTYLYAATSMLAIGLYGSTYAISLPDARRNVNTVVAAVTVGVLAKSLVISGLTYLLFRQPIFLVLGVAVAQIDPLSAAALTSRSSMSSRAKVILAAWASFDDPMTVLITIYAAMFSLKALRSHSGASFGLSASDSVLGYLANLGANLAFAGIVGTIWLLARSVGRRGWLAYHRPARTSSVAGTGQSPTSGRRQSHVAWQGAAAGILTVLAAIAVWRFWMLGLAMLGLIFRPRVLADWLERTVRIAFVLASVVLGMFLAHGIDVVYGIVLGAVAFGAQALVSVPLTGKLARNDRVKLALVQQNGVTAILLALLLQPNFPQATAIVGPAILTINVVHLVANSLWDSQPAIIARRLNGLRRAHDDDLEPARVASASSRDRSAVASGTVYAAGEAVEGVPHVRPT